MVADPTLLYRLRDGVYAPDLLIVAVAELDLFTWLAGHGPASTATVAAGLGLADRPADVMLTYLTALGLLERAGDEITATALARDHLTAGSPYDLRPYYASLRERPGCGELLAVLRSGQPAAWASAQAGADWAGRLVADPGFAWQLTAAMDARARFLGPPLAEALRELPVRRVLDIGGGSGAYACAIADRLPVTGAVLERPPVETAARTLLAERGYADRIGVISADMFAVPLPAGFDLHLFSHVLHDWGEEQVRSLLAASYAALPPGGFLADHDVHLNEAKTGPLAAAEYSVLLMHSTPGKCWSSGELERMLLDTGFASVTSRQVTADRSVLIARKPVADGAPGTESMGG